MLLLQAGKELLAQRSEACHDVFPDQLLDFPDVSLLRNLDLQFAPAKPQIKDFLHTRNLALWKAELGIVLGDLVAAGDTEIDAALSNKCRDVSGGKEDEGDRQVLDQGDIEAVFTAELDVAAG